MSEQPNETNRENVEKVVATIAGVANVEAAFGPSRTVGEYTIIPVAEIIGGMGTGYAGERDSTGAGGSGGGAGGAITTRPIATVVVGPAGVEVKPVYDLTKIWLAALGTLAFSLGWAARLRGGRAACCTDDPAKALKGVRKALR